MANSPALVSLKLCIFFRLFPPFSVFFCPFSTFFCLFPPLSVLSFLFLSSSAFPYPFLSFPILLLSFFCLINSSLPFIVLLYPFTPSFILSSLLALIFCLIPLFTIPQSFISYSFILIRPFSSLSLYIPFYLCFIYSYSFLCVPVVVI